MTRLLSSPLGRFLGLDGFTARQLPSVLGRDLLGGMVSFLVTLSFGLSFAAMIFTGDLASKLPQGISMALMCAGVTIIVIALYSPFYFAIAGRTRARRPCRARWRYRWSPRSGAGRTPSRS